jgi:hypothetical protein
MLAHVHTVLGENEAALRYARRTLELTVRYAAELADFDFAYAYECMGRAQALAGNKSEALKYIDQARQAGAAIRNEEDRRIFDNDINGGDWYGVKE